jgi:two-component system chemotaxis response regulator CheB
MSEIKVVKVFPGRRNAYFKSPENSMPEKCRPLSKTNRDIELIAIGASTGGPMALLKILSGLPNKLPVPVLIVQHIAAGFIQGFVEWLSFSSNIPLCIATDGETAKPGTGYVAAEGFHMELRQGLVIKLSTLPPENGLRPSVNHLFRSVAQTLGQHAIGVLLLGMGTDGAMGLKTMKENGAITIIQDEASSVVFGMPGEAFKIGAAGYVLPIEEIPAFLSDLLVKKNVL